jgi:hypothetical protein
MTQALWSGVAAIIAAIAAIIVDKLKADRRFLTPAQVVDESTKRLQFIEYWIKVTAQAETMSDCEAKASAKEQCKKVLQDAVDQMNQASLLPDATGVHTATRSIARFADSILQVLLISRAHRPVFWAPRLVFFFSLAMMFALLRTPGTSLVDPQVFLALLIGFACWVVVYRFDKPSHARAPIPGDAAGQ